jgi:hypothetical protein
MNIIIAQAEVVTGAAKVAEQLSGKSDRYLFLLCLVLLGLAAVWMVRYLTTQNKDLVTQLKTEQSCYEGKLEAIVEKGRESRERLVLSLDRNTGVLERVEKRLDVAKA